MLQSMSWFAIDALARSQFRVFNSLGEQLHLTGDEQRNALLLSQQEWDKWSDFLAEGSLPADPPLPVMLLRLGNVSHQLAVQAEQRTAQA